MNSADGLSVQAFAMMCGINLGGATPPPVVTPPPVSTPTTPSAPAAPIDLSAIGDLIFTATPALSAQFGV
jgi:hypothetical protein